MCRLDSSLILISMTKWENSILFLLNRLIPLNLNTRRMTFQWIFFLNSSNELKLDLLFHYLNIKHSRCEFEVKFWVTFYSDVDLKCDIRFYGNNSVIKMRSKGYQLTGLIRSKVGNDYLCNNLSIYCDATTIWAFPNLIFCRRTFAFFNGVGEMTK